MSHSIRFRVSDALALLIIFFALCYALWIPLNAQADLDLGSSGSGNWSGMGNAGPMGVPAPSGNAVGQNQNNPQVNQNNAQQNPGNVNVQAGGNLNFGGGNVNNGGGNVNNGPITLVNPLKAQTISQFLIDLIDVLLVFALPLIVLFIMYAGFLYVTAQGNPGKITTAHTALLWAVVGGVIVLGAKLIVTVIDGTINAF
jgi:hypothetical protein